MKIFLDTVGLIALWNESDQWHLAAEAAMSRLVTARCQFYTSELVLYECGNAAARRSFRAAVPRMRRSLIVKDRLLIASSSEIEAAWSAFSQQDATGASIVDHVSFVLMKRLSMTEAFTNDKHFRSVGFVTSF